MKSAKQWFDAYAVSHQNNTNINIHFVCVPAIYFSIVGLLQTIPTELLQGLFNLQNPIIENWAFIICALALLFYAKLGLKIFVQMLTFTIFCYAVNHFLGLYISLFYTSIIIFIIAWIGQFYGHKIEGKKPSFLEDLQFLLIGPAWVFFKIFK